MRSRTWDQSEALPPRPYFHTHAGQAPCAWSVQPSRAGWTHRLLRRLGYVLGFISSERTPDDPLGQTFGRPPPPPHTSLRQVGQAPHPWSVQPSQAGWTHRLLRRRDYVLGFISRERTPDVPLVRTFPLTPTPHHTPTHLINPGEGVVRLVKPR